MIKIENLTNFFCFLIAFFPNERNLSTIQIKDFTNSEFETITFNLS